MFRRILVPLDGSSEGEKILAHVPQVCEADPEIILFHAIPPEPLPMGRAVAVKKQGVRRQQTYLNRVDVPTGVNRVLRVVRNGDPAPQILRAARDLQADLIAMSTHGRTGLERLLMGSVAEEVVRGADVPLLLSKPSTPLPDGPIRRILVPVDGTEPSFGVLDDVRGLANRRSAQIMLFQVMHVAPMLAPVAGAGSALRSGLPQPGPELREHAAALRLDGLPVSTSLAYGEPVDEIIGVAMKEDFDLIAMASRGRRGVSRLLLGSVAESVLRVSRRPILLRRVAGEGE